MERRGALCSSGCNNSKSCAVKKPEALRQSVRNLTAFHVMCEQAVLARRPPEAQPRRAAAAVAAPTRRRGRARKRDGRADARQSKRRARAVPVFR